MGIINCTSPLCGCSDACPDAQTDEDKINTHIEQIGENITDSFISNNTPQPNEYTGPSNNHLQLNPLDLNASVPPYDPTLMDVTSLDEKTMRLFLKVETPKSRDLLIPETQTTDIIQSQKRLSQIMISDLTDLEDTIRSNYDMSQSDHDDEYDSMDEDEQNETQKPKIDKKMLYRKGTIHAWEEDDIDDLLDEMATEFEALKQQATPRDIYKLNRSGRLSQVIVIPQDIENEFQFTNIKNDNRLNLGTSHNLLRDESSEHWGDAKIAREKEEMAKEMIHLVKSQQQHSIESVQIKYGNTV